MAQRIEAATGINTQQLLDIFKEVAPLVWIGLCICHERLQLNCYVGESNQVVAHCQGEFMSCDIEKAIAMDKEIDPFIYRISKKLSR